MADMAEIQPADQTTSVSLVLIWLYKQWERKR